ncbi:unnamed protein product [Trifolium pratense]|uniref:Uncharacterized protein n=1 Tax=Trifolium pratense TaxID=57577 RepID=A0ACB0M147_TRIPR|nr:unnamed protein product [Trifolium pratense]
MAMEKEEEELKKEKDRLLAMDLMVSLGSMLSGASTTFLLGQLLGESVKLLSPTDPSSKHESLFQMTSLVIFHLTMAINKNLMVGMKFGVKGQKYKSSTILQCMLICAFLFIIGYCCLAFAIYHVFYVRLNQGPITIAFILIVTAIVALALKPYHDCM